MQRIIWMVWCINLSADTFHNSTYANNEYFIWNVLTLFHCHSPSTQQKTSSSSSNLTTSIKNWKPFQLHFLCKLFVCCFHYNSFKIYVLWVCRYLTLLVIYIPGVFHDQLSWGNLEIILLLGFKFLLKLTTQASLLQK